MNATSGWYDLMQVIAMRGIAGPLLWVTGLFIVSLAVVAYAGAHWR